MSIIFDATSNSGAKSGVSSFSWNHTVGTGANAILVVGVGARDATLGDRTVSDITYNSVSLTKLVPATVDAPGSVMQSTLWYLVNPSTGVNSIAVTMGGTIDVAAFGGAGSFFGVNQTTPVNTSTSSSGIDIDATVNITPTVNNSWTVDYIYDRDDTGMTVGSNQTQMFNTNFTAGGVTDNAGMSRRGPINPAALVTDHWTTSNSEDYVISVLALNPFIGSLSALGVGG